MNISQISARKWQGCYKICQVIALCSFSLLRFDDDSILAFLKSSTRPHLIIYFNEVLDWIRVHLDLQYCHWWIAPLKCRTCSNEIQSLFYGKIDTIDQVEEFNRLKILQLQQNGLAGFRTHKCCWYLAQLRHISIKKY